MKDILTNGSIVSPPPLVASSSHIGGDEEKPYSTVGIEVEGMVNAPSSK
jgi:hypothetical protein